MIGVPEDSTIMKLSSDVGRSKIHPVSEMKNAFRTPTLRNVECTSPYMHNGTFSTLEQVIDFYNNGGGLGHGLKVPNQTLSSDSLNLTQAEQSAMVAFLGTLSEEISLMPSDTTLPKAKGKLENRTFGGEY